MSSGAPINISAVLDLTGPYRDLAAFRTAAAQPVTLGGGFSPPAQGAATFGAAGGTPYPASSVIASYQPIGPRPTGLGPFFYGQQAAQAGFGVAGAGFQGGGGNAQINAAIQQLTQAAQAIAQVNQGQPPQGGGGPPGQGGGLRGFARYVGPAFLTHEALRFAQDARQTNIESILASNDPLSQIAAEQNFIQRVSNFPILGQAAGLLADPVGNKQAGIQATLRNSQLSDEYSNRQLRLSNETQAAVASGNIAGLHGPARTSAQIDEAFRRQSSEITERRISEGAANAEFARSDRAVIEARYAPSWYAGRRSDGTYLGVDYDNKNAELAIADATARGRNARTTQYLSDQRGAAEAERNAARADSQFSQGQTLTTLHNETLRNQRSQPQFQDRERLRQIDYEQDRVKGAAIARDPNAGPDAERKFYDLRQSQYDLEDIRYKRSVSSDSFQLRNSGQATIRRASGDSFGAQISQLYGSFRERIDNETRPELRGPILQNFIQGIQGAFISESQKYEGIDSSTSSINASINRQPILAQHIALDQERKVALRDTESLPGAIGDRARDSINRNFDARRQAGDQEFNDQTRHITRRLDDSIARLDIQNDRSIDPYARDVRARSNDILTDVRNRSEDIARSGRGSDAIYSRIRREATGRFDQERNQLLEGIQGASFDPRFTPTSGVGTFNLGAALGGLDEDKKRIAAEQAAGVGAAAKDTPTAAAITKGTEDIINVLKAIPGINDILSILKNL